MFQAEAAGLECLRGSNAMAAPRPLAIGTADNQAFLVLEAIDFGRPPGDWTSMGKQLATLHRTTHSTFGWHRDNYIGSTPQSNRANIEWSTFFREERMSPQFELAIEQGIAIAGANELLDSIEALLAGHSPQPSLLHGDLWSGNAGWNDSGEPVIFDPACYFGDRETDLAFTEMFGGFPRSFYQSYQDTWPLAAGYERRKSLYNLYHIVNHANLFGGGYRSQAEQVIRSLLNQSG